MKRILLLLVGMLVGAAVVASVTRKRAYTIMSRNDYTKGY